MHKFAVETPDGILRLFNTPTPYAPRSLVYTLNGRTRTEGWTERGGTLVEVDEAPLPGDVVSFWYTQT